MIDRFAVRFLMTKYISNCRTSFVSTDYWLGLGLFEIVCDHNVPNKLMNRDHVEVNIVAGLKLAL